MSEKTRIGLLGYSGRMGQAIAAEIATGDSCILTAGLTRRAAPEHANLLLSRLPETVVDACDVVIDFTLPDATPDHALLAAKLGKPIVIGVTGLDAEALAILKQAAEKTAVLYAPNTSLSLAAMKRVTELTAKLLAKFDYDIAIYDEHHRMKKDAPSGTAIALGEAVLKGNAGLKKPGYASIRAGHIVGTHEIIFTGNDETIRLHHSVTDRRIFARGAIQAALWLKDKPPGFYGMDDVLGL
jgi:4-hydroxy-tetrahydrodipicolinate reductase